MIDSQVLAFTGIAAVLTLTPGADTMLVMRNVLERGQRAGLLTTFGICTGLFFHATLSALGLSLILVRSATAFEVVKMVGACYLVFLGGQSIWRAIRHKAESSDVPESKVAVHEKKGWQSYLEGLLTNVLNPKVAIFYLAFLPQFISVSDSVFAKSILLASIHFVLGIAWLSLVTLLLGRVRALLTRPRIKRAIEATTGAVLIAFGARLAMERR
ncbi:MAG TPA: LysE family translocator [Pyrinomonadaceae bacterium]|nr:LysE family translocator [Pyrinomonadaceae bacterium]